MSSNWASSLKSLWGICKDPVYRSFTVHHLSRTAKLNLMNDFTLVKGKVIFVSLNSVTKVLWLWSSNEFLRIFLALYCGFLPIIDFPWKAINAVIRLLDISYRAFCHFFCIKSIKKPRKYPFQAALASSKEAFIGDVCILAKLKVTSKGDALLTRRIGISAGLADWKNVLTLLWTKMVSLLRFIFFFKWLTLKLRW